VVHGLRIVNLLEMKIIYAYKGRESILQKVVNGVVGEK
jgi:hypothetical protein